MFYLIAAVLELKLFYFTFSNVMLVKISIFACSLNDKKKKNVIIRLHFFKDLKEQQMHSFIFI